MERRTKDTADERWRFPKLGQCRVRIVGADDLCIRQVEAAQLLTMLAQDTFECRGRYIEIAACIANDSAINQARGDAGSKMKRRIKLEFVVYLNKHCLLYPSYDVTKS